MWMKYLRITERVKLSLLLEIHLARILLTKHFKSIYP